MTRTRWAGHAWLLSAITLTTAGIYTAITVAWWWCLPAWAATSLSAGLAYGYYRRAGREEEIARRLADLRRTPAAAHQIPPERVERLRKDSA